MTTETAPSTSPAAPSSSAPATPTRPRTARKLALFVLLLIAIVLMLFNLGVFEPRHKVALVTAGQGQYWDLIAHGAEDAAHRYNLKLKLVRSKSDEPSQTAEIHNLLGQHFDAIAISPNDPQRQAAVLSEVTADTNLVTFDSDSAVSRRLCFIGTNNYEAGRDCADLIRQAIPDGGEVILAIGSLDKENGQRRRQGVIDQLLDRSIAPNREMDPVGAPLKGSKYTIVATLVDGIDPAKATDLAAAALKDHPNVKCFAGLFAYNTPAILRALQSASKPAGVKVVGFDAYDETLNGIDQGTVFGAVVQDAYSIGFETVRVMSDAAKDDRRALPLYSTFYLSCDPVTQANVAQVREDLHRKMSGKAGAPHAADITPKAAPAAASTHPAPAPTAPAAP